MQKKIEQIEIPVFAERMLGVTVPENGSMYACSYDGLHRIELSNPVSIETDEDKIEDYDALEALGQALGIMGGMPILENDSMKIAYEFDYKKDEQIVEIDKNGSVEKISFPTLSGDWFYATLSKCGHFLLLAEPYSIAVYKLNKNEAYQDGAHNVRKRTP